MSLPSRRDGPGRLRSLWDLMKPFHPDSFLDGIRMLETVIRVPQGQSIHSPQAQSAFSDTAEMCKTEGLTASLASTEKILRLLSKKDCSEHRVRELVIELQERMIDELSAPRFFSLSDSEVGHYNDWPKGWTEIIDRFPAATSDVEEMRKCFALSRYAASVFHSVQVIEHGLIDLGKFLSVKDRKDGWVATSNELKRIATADHRNRTAFENDNFTFIEQTHGLVEALKNAWRHKIGHASGRLAVLTADFKPETAEDIMSATRAFMRRSASDLPPKPTA
jgi:hypothetical protein